MSYEYLIEKKKRLMLGLLSVHCTDVSDNSASTRFRFEEIYGKNQKVVF